MDQQNKDEQIENNISTIEYVDKRINTKNV